MGGFYHIVLQYDINSLKLGSKTLIFFINICYCVCTQSLFFFCICFCHPPLERPTLYKDRFYETSSVVFIEGDHCILEPKKKLIKYFWKMLLRIYFSVNCDLNFIYMWFCDWTCSPIKWQICWHSQSIIKYCSLIEAKLILTWATLFYDGQPKLKGRLPGVTISVIRQSQSS